LDLQLEAFGLKKIAADCPWGLRYGDTFEFQATPRGETDLTQPKGRIETLAKFLLNALMRAL
jgi:hypothetical protein